MGRILDLFINKYNYTDFHELNLDWIISDLRTLAETLENFISLNTIKYANPIQWNITTQYETNTVVIDANDGTAYLSVKPVPSGVALTNTDYWTPIFTLNLLSANQNITLRDDGSNVIATFASDTDDWLIWNSTLYKVSRPISINEAYVPGYNLDRYSVELFIKDYITAISNIIGDLTDLTTTDKTSLVNAANELNAAIGDITVLTTTDKTSLVNAVNELNAAIGDLANLTTTDKTSLVNAINELNSKSVTWTDPIEYGAVGDGVTDDTSAFTSMFDDSTVSTINLKGRSYVINNKTYILQRNITIINGTLIVNGVDTTSGTDWDYPYQFLLFPMNSKLIMDNVNIEYSTINGQIRSWQGIGGNLAELILKNCNFTTTNTTAITSLSIVFVHTASMKNVLIDNCTMINTYQGLSGCIYNSQDASTINCDNFTICNSYLESCGTDEIMALWGQYGYDAIDIYNNVLINGGTNMSFMMDLYGIIDYSDRTIYGTNRKINIENNTFTTVDNTCKCSKAIRTLRGGTITDNKFVDCRTNDTIIYAEHFTNSLPLNIIGNIAIGNCAASRVIETYIDFSDQITIDGFDGTQITDVGYTFYFGYTDVLIKNCKLPAATTAINASNKTITLLNNDLGAFDLTSTNLVLLNNNISDTTKNLFTGGSVTLQSNKGGTFRFAYGPVSSLILLANICNYIGQNSETFDAANKAWFSSSGYSLSNLSTSGTLLFEGAF